MLYVFGRGEDGQLGLGVRHDRDVPSELMKFASGGRVRQIALGSGHSLVLTCDGEVYATGRGDDGRLGLGSPMEWVSTPRRVRLGSGGGGQAAARARVEWHARLQPAHALEAAALVAVD